MSDEFKVMFMKGVAMVIENYVVDLGSNLRFDFLTKVLFDPMLIFFLLGSIILVIASFEDIKKREVADLVSYSILFSALSLRALYSFSYGYQFFLSGLIGFIICFALALLLYYTNQWGGADSKILMGLGGLLGVDFLFPKLISNLNLNYFQGAFFDLNQQLLGWQLILFLFLMIFVGAIWSLLWSMWLVLFNFEKFWISFGKKNKAMKNYLIFSVVIFLLFLGLGLSYGVSLLVLAIFPIFAYFSYVFVSSVEDSLFIVSKKIRDLVEGDWLAEKVFLNVKEKVRGKRSKKVTLRPKALTREDLKLLTELRVLEDTVMVKEGVPFVPSFLIAYLVLFIFSSILPEIWDMFFF